jgi:hypothetical protein
LGIENTPKIMGKIALFVMAEHSYSSWALGGSKVIKGHAAFDAQLDAPQAGARGSSAGVG